MATSNSVPIDFGAHVLRNSPFHISVNISNVIVSELTQNTACYCKSVDFTEWCHIDRVCEKTRRQLAVWQIVGLRCQLILNASLQTAPCPPPLTSLPGHWRHRLELVQECWLRARCSWCARGISAVRSVAKPQFYRRPQDFTEPPVSQQIWNLPRVFLCGAYM